MQQWIYTFLFLLLLFAFCLINKFIYSLQTPSHISMWVAIRKIHKLSSVNAARRTQVQNQSLQTTIILFTFYLNENKKTATKCLNRKWNWFCYCKKRISFFLFHFVDKKLLFFCFIFQKKKVVWKWGTSYTNRTIKIYSNDLFCVDPDARYILLNANVSFIRIGYVYSCWYIYLH